jgi:hypothetical protein
MVALYEMLRVARNGVLLIEPNDAYIINKYSEILFRNLKNIVKYLLVKNTNKHSFEESGNYVFSISRREIEKVALGLNYKVVAFKGINDTYIKGVEYEKVYNNGPLQSKIRRVINIKNALCKLGVIDYDLLASIIFKILPSKDIHQQLIKKGYQIVQLLKNPYISV